jgi:purine-nucleoside phosphorylase
MSEYAVVIDRAHDYMQSRFSGEAETGLILGSGLGMIADEVQERTTIPYADIPGFPVSTIPGHRGEAIFGKLGGRHVLIYSGRFHYYQGFSFQEITLPVRLAARLGVRNMIVTNACGGINEAFNPGDIMIIKDHINLMGGNPLIGADASVFGTPFIDMSDPYDGELRKAAIGLSSKNPRIGKLQEGVYIAVSGPSYETRSEISFFKHIGADAVGMSTVPEVIVCRQEGIRVLGISAVSNMAAGIQKEALSHQEVLDTTAQMSSRLILLIKELLQHVLT